ASYDHVTSNSQPLLYVTASRPTGTSASGTPVTGGYDDVNRTNAPIRVLGASGIEHQQQDRFKLKAALDVTSAIRLTYVGALFLNNTDAVAQTYLTDTTIGQPTYAGSFNIDGRAYPVAPSAFSGGTYTQDQRHWSHSLSATGSSKAVDWQVIGTLYDYAHDVQRVPTTALPAAEAGGAGTIARLDGTGWTTLDAKAAWHGGNHIVSAGAHFDRFVLNSNRYATTDWIAGGDDALNLQSKGKTRTAALWAQDAWTPIADVTLTLGGRYEGWRAYDGRNYSLSPAIAATQPTLDAARFSPKASVAWTATPNWTAQASFGTAWRFPTVGELYQIVTTPVAAVPNPNLRPERALSEEISLEHHDDHGLVRVALFNESVKDALISQTGPLNGTTTLATFVQNVDRTRARGIEAVVQRTDVIDRFDLSASVTYADATTRANTVFPASVGKRLPQVPAWKATLVGTWRPADGIALTAAGRYASRLYGTLDNSDIVGNTYQGFYKYLVVDLRAQFRVGDHYTLGLGVDNVGNDRYFLFHPFPQRSFQADLTWKL
ncbi:MAG: TonB-dependent receptor, partial [Sphingomonas sp.]